MSVTLYVDTPDQLTVEGDIEDTFDLDDVNCVVALSNGLVITVNAYPGCWQFNVLNDGGTEPVIERGAVRGEDCHSDRVTVPGDVRWVVVGQQYSRQTEEIVG